MRDELDFELECFCDHCDYAENVLVREQDYNSWHNGVFAQDAFPYLTAAQRELMISRTCNQCWKEFFPSDEYDDD